MRCQIPSYGSQFTIETYGEWMTDNGTPSEEKTDFGES